ncbi:MAG: hypothetical protein ACTHKB_03635 [Burkholderiaceae bacterium]
MDRFPASPRPAPRRTAFVTPSSAKGAREFLDASGGISPLLPAVTRMAGLQRDCAAALPTMFDTCAVLQFSAGQLVLSAPNAALAARLRQHLPKLQESLCRRGWQVSAVRVRLQVARPAAVRPAAPPRALPDAARGAFAALKATLDDSPRNAALSQALQTLLQRHAPDAD